MNLRVGMVGSGWVTEAHLKSSAHWVHGRPVAVAARDGARAKALAERHGLSAYADPKDMIAGEKLDAVWICLPPHAHGDLERHCAGRVKGVMVEKPVELDIAAARANRDAFARAGTVAAAGYMNRCRPVLRRIRDLLAADTDKPVLVTGRWIGPMPGPAWWRRRETSGGQYVEQLTHLVDLARWLVGPIESVTACSARGFVTDVANYDVDDATASIVRFASGAVGSFVTGCFSREKGAADDVELVIGARNRGVRLSGWALDATLSHAGKPDPERPRQADVEAAGGIFALQGQAFLAAVAADKPEMLPSTYADAVETLRTTLAATRSAASGIAIRVEDI